MRDATFRRHFLVQAAALLHYIRHPISTKSGAGGGGVGAGKAAVTAMSGRGHEGFDELVEKVSKSGLDAASPLI